jgi:hypothetical protein
MSDRFRELVAEADPAALRDALVPVAKQRIRANLAVLRPALASTVARGGDPIFWKLTIIVMAAMEHARVVRRRADEKRRDLSSGKGAALWRIKLLDAESAAYLQVAAETRRRQRLYRKALAITPVAERPQWRADSATRIEHVGPLPTVDFAPPVDDAWAECEATPLSDFPVLHPLWWEADDA